MSADMSTKTAVALVAANAVMGASLVLGVSTIPAEAQRQQQIAQRLDAAAAELDSIAATLRRVERLV